MPNRQSYTSNKILYPHPQTRNTRTDMWAHNTSDIYGSALGFLVLLPNLGPNFPSPQCRRRPDTRCDASHTTREVETREWRPTLATRPQHPEDLNPIGASLRPQPLTACLQASRAQALALARGSSATDTSSFDRLTPPHPSPDAGRLQL